MQSDYNCVSDGATDNAELQSDRQYRVAERQSIQSCRVTDCVSDGATDSTCELYHATDLDSVSDRVRATDSTSLSDRPRD